MSSSDVLDGAASDATVFPVGGACRLCGAPLARTVVDLGMSPLCESFLTAGQCHEMERFYPLHVQVCDACLLVQLQQYVSPGEIFTEYAYFSSYSSSWVEHARRYCHEMVARLGLTRDSLVVELASNDGYLLAHLVALGIPVLGVEPARNVAAEAIARGVPTCMEFFGAELARRLVAEGRAADLIVANNVLAQVPDVNDFVAGMKILLAPGGTATVEFPHLVRLFEESQFDTIYHEHFSYFTLISARALFGRHGLSVCEVERLPTHGGSLRLHLRHATAGAAPHESVGAVLAEEHAGGFGSVERYLCFAPQVERVKRRLLRFLIEAKENGQTTVGYGAPGKGNTLLNYCGVRTDLLAYTVDRNPYKHGRFLPGTHIPVYPPEMISQTRPDFVLILPWNLRDEIVGQLEGIRSWGGRFVVPIPEVAVL